jgi:hypothetical protein
MPYRIKYRNNRFTGKVKIVSEKGQARNGAIVLRSKKMSGFLLKKGLNLQMKGSTQTDKE